MSTPKTLDVPRTSNFPLTGLGDHPAWERASRVAMPSEAPLENPRAYDTWFKALWSDTGVYFLVHCVDPILTCTGLKNNENLFTEDVVEVFLWPDETRDLYFEYEISPLNAELPILVPNVGGRFHGWLPWHYEGNRRTRHATFINGPVPGSFAPGSPITSWTAEFFIPTALLAPMGNLKLAPGVIWRANVYRIDRDKPGSRQFAWQGVKGNFHDFRGFGSFRFVE